MLREIYSFIKGKDIILPKDKKRAISFDTEIEQCLSFLEDKLSKTEKSRQTLNYVHSNGIEFGRVKDGNKEYFFRKQVLYAPELPPYVEIFSTQNGRVLKTKINLMDNSVLSKPEVASKQDISGIAEDIKNVKITL